MKNDGVWLSILEYARYRGISISTIRRYIKAERVRFKQEAGKYFIFVSDANLLSQDGLQEENDLYVENQRLKRELQATIEERDDLRLLVEIYEQKKKQNFMVELPPIPNQ